MTKIFIAGCARSGTTLTLRLMRCFADTETCRKEAPVARFGDLYGPERVKVIKRTAVCYRYLPMLPDNIELLYCVRHPFDVLTSWHHRAAPGDPFHVDQRRWLAEYDGLCGLRAAQPTRRILYSRYEDLVAAPEMAQQRISEFFGLIVDKPFREHETIATTSVQKWKSKPALHDYLISLPPEFKQRIEDFCREFGYDCQL